MDDWQRFHWLMEQNGMNTPAYAEWRAAYAENSELWPIARDGKMIGGVLFKGHTVHIVVDPQWHGRWITKPLVRAAKTWAHEVPIETIIRPDNVPSVRLAQAAGFHFAGDAGIFHKYVKAPNHELQPN